MRCTIIQHVEGPDNPQRVFRRIDTSMVIPGTKGFRWFCIRVVLRIPFRMTVALFSYAVFRGKKRKGW